MFDMNIISLKRLIHVVDWLPTLLSASRKNLGREKRKMVDKFLAENREGYAEVEAIDQGSEGLAFAK